MQKKNYGKIFNIRVPPQKQAIIDEFKELVIEDLHSNICYVTTMLLESFVKANRGFSDPTVMKLVKQEITINQNCTNIYGSQGRARRLMPKTELEQRALPQCEFCDLPATRRYLYPLHGYIDVCVNHRSKAPKLDCLGYKKAPSIGPALKMGPAFQALEKPRARQRGPSSVSTRRKRKKKIKFRPTLWTRVKQFLTKLLWRLFYG